MTKSKFEDYFSQHVAAAFDKQSRLGDLLGQHNWSFSMDQGLLTFTAAQATYNFEVQLLGTEATEDNSWLWIWANEASHVPAKLTEAALNLQALGKKEAITEFTEAELALTTDFNGHHLALVASGLTKAGCYYRGAYSGGALYLLVTDPQFEELTAIEPSTLSLRIPSVFSQVIASLPVKNHRVALRSYFEFYKLDIAEDSTSLTASGTKVKPIKAEFDKHNRLLEIQSVSGK